MEPYLTGRSRPDPVAVVCLRPCLCAHAARLLLLSLTALLAGSGALQAQPGFVRYGSANGMPARATLALAQDRRGFLWIGSEFALTRFDGVHARTFHPDPGHAGALGGPIALALAPDPSGEGVVVWTIPGGLQRYVPARDRFEPIETRPAAIPGQTYVFRIALGPNRTLWLATGDGAVVVEPGRAPRRVTGPAGEALEVEGLAVEPSGRAWLAATEGLFRVEPGAARAQPVSFPASAGPPSAVIVGAAGRIIVGTDRGLFESTRRTRQEPPRWRRIASTALVNALAFDPAGTLWAATASGLVHVAHGQSEVFGAGPSPEGLPAPRVRDVLVDRSGTLWATNQGVVARPTRASPFTDALAPFAHAPGSTGVLGGGVDPDGTLWVATMTQGLLRCRNAACVQVPGLPSGSWFNTLATGADGVRYVAAYDRGLWCLDARGVRACPDLPEGLRNPRGLARGAGGRLWLSTADRATFVRDLRNPGGEWKALPLAKRPGAPDALPPSPLPIAPIGAGPHAWIGTMGGGLYLASDTGARPSVRHVPLTPDDAAIRLRIPSLALRGDTLYAATLGYGVARVIGTGPRAAVHWIRSAEGLPSEVVPALAVDADGHVWAMTDAGVARLHPDGHASSFGPSEGWPDVELCWHASFAGPDGRLFVGTTQGLVVFHPRELAAAAAPPRPILTGLRVLGQFHADHAAAASPLRLRHDQNVLSVDLATGVPGPSRPWTYAYRLVRAGQSAAWQSLGTRATLDLAGIAPGRYHLDVRTDLSGQVSPAASMAFVVAPPWWATLWFRSLLALALAGLLIAAYRARIAHLLALERTRRRIADDLHDDLGSKLAALALQLDVAELLAPPQAAANGLPSHAASARALVGDLSDVVWLIDAHADRLEDLADKFERVAYSMLPPYSYRVHVGALPARTIPAETRRHLLQAMREMLHNAVRHGVPPYALTVTTAGEMSVLTITLAHPRKDVNTAPVPSGGRGLSTLRRRASALGGAFSLVLTQEEAQATFAVPLKPRPRWRPMWFSLRKRTSNHEG